MRVVLARSGEGGAAGDPPAPHTEGGDGRDGRPRASYADGEGMMSEKSADQIIESMRALLNDAYDRGVRDGWGMARNALASDPPMGTDGRRAFRRGRRGNIRARVLDYIRSHPGLRAREVSEEMGTNLNTTRYVIHMLRLDGLVRSDDGVCYIREDQI